MRVRKDIPIKKVELKNNCPECFNNNGLNLTFKQTYIENSFQKFVTNNINYEINCDTCKSTIYPERWDDDIERVFEYQKRAFTPRATSRQLKKGAWILIFSCLILIAGASWLVINS